VYGLLSILITSVEDQIANGFIPDKVGWIRRLFGHNIMVGFITDEVRTFAGWSAIFRRS
jgi:hypothetical protein